jgi:hypothetical protein
MGKMQSAHLPWQNVAKINFRQWDNHSSPVQVELALVPPAKE